MRRESDTLRPGDRAPDFTLEDGNGRAHALKDLLVEPAAREGRPLQTLLLVFDRGTW